jgi:hypothetical protein
MRKCTNEVNRAFSKEEVQMAKKHGKMLTIPGHKRNENQNHIRAKQFLLGSEGVGKRGRGWGERKGAGGKGE